LTETRKLAFENELLYFLSGNCSGGFAKKQCADFMVGKSGGPGGMVPVQKGGGCNAETSAYGSLVGEHGPPKNKKSIKHLIALVGK